MRRTERVRRRASVASSDATVFLVDDDASVRKATARLLRSAGLHIEMFATALEFLERGRPETPGCLVLDVRMPGLTGLELQDELAYTTILTILRRLEEKGHVEHSPDGKAHRYVPLVRREQAQDSALQRMTRKLFGDSPELLMSRLLRKGVLTEDQLRELRELVDKRLRERGEG